MKSPDQVVRLDPRTGERMGRFWSFIARAGFIDSIVETPYTRELQARAAEQATQDRAIDRGAFAARAIYSTRHAQERGPVPREYQPGAYERPQFPRSGVANDLLPRGATVTVGELPPNVSYESWKGYFPKPEGELIAAGGPAQPGLVGSGKP